MNPNATIPTMQHKKTVLLAVVGTSPAVLTETLWALYKEKPEYVPDEVHICSTSTGVAKAKAALATPTTNGNTVLFDLKHAVGKEQMKIDYHEFTDPKDGLPLTDIQTSKDQELVADQLLEEVRKLKNPMQEECRIVCSVAGGRKSMSALMYAVMSLAGDGGDIITHVLADERATSCPDFFYPGQKKQKLMNKAGVAFTAKEILVELAQIPFVPLRSLVGEKQLSKAAGSFETLVKRARNELDSVKPEGISIRLSTTEMQAVINGERLTLPPDAYLMLALMVHSRIMDTQKGRPPKPLTYQRCCKMLELLLKDNLLPKNLQLRFGITENRKQLYNDLIHNKQAAVKAMPQSITKEKFNLKKALQNAGFSAVAEDALEGKQFGFLKITDVGYDLPIPTAPPQQSKKAATKKPR